jgi:hypothetical protein
MYTSLLLFLTRETKGYDNSMIIVSRNTVSG